MGRPQHDAQHHVDASLRDVPSGAAVQPHALVVAGAVRADLEPPGTVAELLNTATVRIAADSGWHTLARWGRLPDELVGDLDSIDPDQLAVAETAAAAGELRIRRAARAKDRTDLELALGLVSGPERIHEVGSVTVVVGAGGRLDHVLGSLAALAGVEERLHVAAWFDDTRVLRLCGGDELRIVGTPGAVVSLIPWGGPAEGVVSSGLRWNLDDESVRVDAARGVSDEFLQPHASVSIERGVLFVLIPSTHPQETNHA
jgi:thiamine pyrophosphokinase